MTNKDYLGDSVYIDIEHDGLMLTTENGMDGGPSNNIYLEKAVFEALLRYVERHVTLKNLTPSWRPK